MTFNAILPVYHVRSIDERYHEALSFLDAEQAIVHLIAPYSNTVASDLARRGISHHNDLIDQLYHGLRMEMMDQLARKLSKHYPNLSFEYYLGTPSVEAKIQALGEKAPMQLLVTDNIELTPSKNETFVWLVEGAEDDSSENDLATSFNAEVIRKTATDLNGHAQL